MQSTSLRSVSFVNDVLDNRASLSVCRENTFSLYHPRLFGISVRSLCLTTQMNASQSQNWKPCLATSNEQLRLHILYHYDSSLGSHMSIDSRNLYCTRFSYVSRNAIQFQLILLVFSLFISSHYA